MYQVTAEYSNDRKETINSVDWFRIGESIWSPTFKESGVVTKVVSQKLLKEDVRDRMFKNMLTVEDHEFLKGMNVRWEI